MRVAKLLGLPTMGLLREYDDFGYVVGVRPAVSIRLPWLLAGQSLYATRGVDVLHWMSRN